MWPSGLVVSRANPGCSAANASTTASFSSCSRLQVLYTSRPPGLTNPAAVAVGISEALITTATGLIIAIPAQLIYNWYTTKITRFVRDIETASNMLVETFSEMDSQRYGQGGEGQA